ncbi:hypothetical protein [Methanopyrus kandleri]|uniref:Uncharacterized protein n=1 Tax=Methanopyrus kandleri TaxID=2320 RepID=A0A832TB72_9EURY|nr:hypothetical protein [Methanopyrus kandleri]HII69668.1 hypothetical protein [Methanopyrus kandleri]
MLPALVLIIAVSIAMTPAHGRVGGFVSGHYYLDPEFDAPNTSFGSDIDGDGRVDRIWCAEACAVDMYNLGVAMGWWNGDPVTPLQYEISATGEHDDDNLDIIDAFQAIAGSDAASKVFEVAVVSLLNRPSVYHAVLVLGAVQEGSRRYFVVDDESTSDVGELLLVPYDLFLSNLHPGILEFFGPVEVVNRLYSVLSGAISPLTVIVSSKRGRTLTVVLLTDLPGDSLAAFTEELWKAALEGYPVAVAVSKPFLDLGGVTRIRCDAPVTGDVETRRPLNGVESGEGPSPPLGIPIPFIGTVGIAGLFFLLLTFLGLSYLPV